MGRIELLSDADMCLQRVAAVAPAGFGKTERIAGAVASPNARTLILTHTNAGVRALRQRIYSKEVPAFSYRVATIAGWCESWVSTYRATTGYSSFAELKGASPSAYYPRVYAAMKKLLGCEWVADSLKSSYSRVLVDEYQDCTMTQNELILSLSETIPITVFGDPMQGIFYWTKDDQLVNWGCLNMPIRDMGGKPWRWINSGHESLGRYVQEVREMLLPTLDGRDVSLTLKTDCSDVQIISKDELRKWQPERNDGSAVFLSTIKGVQNGFSNRHHGFQSNEAVDNPEAKEFCERVDSEVGTDLALVVLGFLGRCYTRMNQQMSSYVRHLKNGDFDFRRISKHSDVGRTLTVLESHSTIEAVWNIISAVNECKDFRLYRGVLVWEVTKALELAMENQTTALEGLELCRSRGVSFRDYCPFPRLSSRTVLSKGLEYDTSIVDVSSMPDPRDLYVAISRCKKKLVLVSDCQTLQLRGI
ncbi:MAG: UvrD-helicase domain-containing protein [Atopobiaceae bacterium]|nr:UvrD-helicase domain-containing protein [Atopobiaceae bacterium]MCH4276842.1 UvrD-helicase domain-containing protein [Atopobiaceae bacterium]